ncbi:hypothetical protein IW140_004512 [Coemansia sp. RSA 1813]|nr:hypothetical protein EV178_004674 [Coemansia sp. RSA 1646]KAJ1771174.1 hypothetical protein LPJ74_002563 [Coemansia sp. RSA 1843]KAJ2087802.1 hypothetical protein IW138_004697 [Coemansia sp. RSA 986]KAJ2567379.1 hypothetical protein IW140_004512 [Coemansia sp. RSA 1813]
MASYILRYFPVPARAEICKALLTFVGANWTLEFPEWPKEKDSQPVGNLPVLVVKVESNSTAPFILGDSRAIEKYLATKYDLFYKPNDIQLMARQHEVRAHMNDIYEMSALIIHAPEPARQFFINKYNILTRSVVRNHEKVLRENGSNGHYFGDKTTYIDVSALASLLTLRKTFINSMPELLEPFSNDNAPEINNAVEILSKDPTFAPYIKSLEK